MEGKRKEDRAVEMVTRRTLVPQKVKKEWVREPTITKTRGWRVESSASCFAEYVSRIRVKEQRAIECATAKRKMCSETVSFCISESTEKEKAKAGLPRVCSALNRDGVHLQNRRRSFTFNFPRHGSLLPRYANKESLKPFVLYHLRNWLGSWASANKRAFPIYSMRSV